MLNRVVNDPSLTLKVFAYDLNEPDILKILLTLAAQGRVRIILDNASLHVTQGGPTSRRRKTSSPIFLSNGKKIRRHRTRSVRTLLA